MLNMKQLLRRIYHSIRSPYRVVVLDYPVEPKPLYSFDKPHKKWFDMVAQNNHQYAALLHAVNKHTANLQLIKKAKDETDLLTPTWNNNYVPGLDIIMLYTILNKYTPKNYIEIGSGTTTKTAFKARQENNLGFSITCIDPFPRQEIKTIADVWHDKKIQDVPLELFSSLSENDIVFFDGTHTLFPNSDVMWFFLEVLPILPRGVLVEVHDIYIPYDYPQFMCDRYYSENYILGSVLLANPEKYKIIAPCFYMSEQPQLANIIEELWHHPNLSNVEKHGGSFWFQIN